MTDLTQWARSLFTNITAEVADSDGATYSATYSETLTGKIGASPITAPRQAGEDTSDPASPAPDFRYRPVTTSVRRRG